MSSPWSSMLSGTVRRVPRMALALAGVAVLAACGGGNPSGPSGPTRTVIGTQTGTMASFTAGAHPIRANASGTFDVTLDWGSAANDFDLFVTSDACTTTSLSALETQAAAGCTHLASARSVSAKPERVTFSGTGNVTYRVWVANFGRSADSYTLTAGITTP